MPVFIFWEDTVMERFSTCELREKEVVNMCDGVKLGCPVDFEFNICDGRITALIISGGGGFLGLCRDDDIIIPWNKIECIGSDAILVKIDGDKGSCYSCGGKKRKKGFLF